MSIRIVLKGTALLLVFSMMFLISCKEDSGVDPNDETPTETPTEEEEEEEVVFPTEFADPNANAVLPLMVDKNATDETAALFYNLKMNSAENIIVGHQDAYLNFYANSGVNDEVSDMKLLTGKNPGLFGVDFMFITDEENTGEASNWWYQQELAIIDAVKKAYARGNVIAFTWHFRGDHSERSFYANDLSSTQKQSVFRSILPGGTNHEYYKTKLQKVADIADKLKDENGKPIPFIFRPFHEFDGGWFWWGKPYCTPEEFIQNYRFTVEYLRDELNVHNILYAFAPDNQFSSEPVYLERFPGNDYVDIVGFDNYGDYDGKGQTGIDNAASKLKIVSDYGRMNKKVAALTETGLWVADGGSLSPEDFYTSVILNSLTKEEVEIAFLMFWNNYSTGYYVPTPGKSGASDFIQFEEEVYTLMEDDIAGKMYVFPE
jgi:mannan endo-1,4-beta-mannosidase